MDEGFKAKKAGSSFWCRTQKHLMQPPAELYDPEIKLYHP
jgi:hypothetical protein